MNPVLKGTASSLAKIAFGAPLHDTTRRDEPCRKRPSPDGKRNSSANHSKSKETLSHRNDFLTVRAKINREASVIARKFQLIPFC
jgi:hypothetical protein